MLARYINAPVSTSQREEAWPAVQLGFVAWSGSGGGVRASQVVLQAAASALPATCNSSFGVWVVLGGLVWWHFGGCRRLAG